MNKYLVCLLSAFAVAAAHADHAPGHKGAFTMNGSAEGGFAASFGGTLPKGFNFLVDNIELKKAYTVSEKTKVTMSSAFSVNNGTAAGAWGRALDTRSFYSPAVLGAGGTFTYSVREALISHQCGENWTTSIGLFRTPFGMENMWDRFAMHSYHYTASYGIVHGSLGGAALGFAGGWTYNTGALMNLYGLEWALFTSAVGGGDTRVLPGTALRYKFDVAGGDWTLTPVVSAYLGRFFGGPKDIGASAGAMWKMGTLWANVEFLYGSSKAVTAGASAAKTWSIWVEPGFDLGFANVSAKWEFNEQTTVAAAKTNDMNLSAAISKNYDKLRTRLVYTHANLGGKLGAHGNELRLLVGAEW